MMMHASTVEVLCVAASTINKTIVMELDLNN